MQAVIECGSKQYIIEEGSIIDIDKLADASAKSLTIDRVLLVKNDTQTVIGQPYIDGASVSASILNHYKDDKIIVFKFKNKTGYKLTQGHRQDLITIKVDTISLGSSSSKKTKTVSQETASDDAKKITTKPKTTAKKTS